VRHRWFQRLPARSSLHHSLAKHCALHLSDAQRTEIPVGIFFDLTTLAVAYTKVEPYHNILKGGETMKKTLAATSLSLLFFVSPMQVALADTCSCGTNNCSTVTTCPGSCYAYCSTSGGCGSGCGKGRKGAAKEVTFQVTNSNSEQLSSELTRISGREIVFTASEPDDLFSFDFKRAPVWEVFEELSKRGTVEIDGVDFRALQDLRSALLAGEKISLQFSMPADEMVSWLSFVSGFPLRINSGNAQEHVRIALKEATLQDIIQALSKMGIEVAF
jgi:hypothetical protein